MTAVLDEVLPAYRDRRAARYVDAAAPETVWGALHAVRLAICASRVR